MGLNLKYIYMYQNLLVFGCNLKQLHFWQISILDKKIEQNSFTSMYFI